MSSYDRYERMAKTVGRWSRLAGAKSPDRTDAVVGILGRAVEHDLLWLGAGAALGASGGRTARRSALRGVGAVALVSAANHLLAKPAAASAYPALDRIARVFSQPRTASLPASPTASAAAFATGVLLESPRYGLAVLPVAAAVAAARTYSGTAHHGRTATGIAIGVGAALLTCRWWPVRPEAAAAAAPPRTPAPALADGQGLHLVINPSSGVSWSSDPNATAETLRALLPEADVTVLQPDDDLTELLEEAARKAVEDKGALGVCGGDGTVNAATQTAARHRLPLAVFPGGTFNHFAVDLGNQTLEDVARAVRAGDAVTADVGSVSSTRTGDRQLFLNTFSIGVYSDLVAARELLEKRIGKWPALAIGLAKVLATGHPLSVTVNDAPRHLWLLFAGNGIYHPAGFAPTYRTQLDDGLLDVRAVDAGTPFARTRLILAVLTGTLHTSRVLTTAQVRSLRLEVLHGEPHFAYDGEVIPTPDGPLVLGKQRHAVTVYRPADQDQWIH